MLPPKEGKIAKHQPGVGDVGYDLSIPKKISAGLVNTDRTLTEFKPLDKLVSELGIKKITLYDDLATPGVCPAALTGRSGYGFVPNDTSLREMVDLTKGSAGVKWHWSFKHNAKDNGLSPYACVLTNTKQLIVPHDARLQLEC